jgi:thioredoxin reductase (NADPH)
MAQTEPVAFPTLSSDQLERIATYGTLRHVEAGEVLFTPSDASYDFIAILDASVRILHRGGGEERLIVTHGPGRFIGDLGLMTGAKPLLTAEVERAGSIVSVPVDAFRRLLDGEVDLSRTIVDAFLARRALLQTGEGARIVRILGSRYMPAALRLRQYATRMRLPHVWEDLEDHPDVDAVLAAVGVGADDMPVVVTPTGVLRHPSPGELAETLGLSYQPVEGRVYDVAVVGAGPAGLAAAVYAASEGLSAVVLDAVGPGGQAGTSSMIENYLGFPRGISGRELTERAAAQVQKFGVSITSPCEAAGLEAGSAYHVVRLQGGVEVPARVVVVATGARYRRLPLENWDRFEGAGIYYAATDLETRACSERPVVVVGGGNSAGQAALFLAEEASHVDIVVRRDGLAATMSRYLIARIESHPRITVRPHTRVTAVEGGEGLERVELTGDGGDAVTSACAGLFCFIGADAATAWLPPEVQLDRAGFVLTDRDVTTEAGGAREVLPFESSVPGVFAVGDVRHGSTKRVAAAVGEGSAAIRSAHVYLAERA